MFMNRSVQAGISRPDTKPIRSALDSNIVVQTADSGLLSNIYYRKYHSVLNAQPYFYNQFKLFQFIDKWMGVPYLFGGSTFRGVDCSALTGFFSREVMGIQLPRTAQGQHDYLKLGTFPGLLQTGDLLFFHTTRPGISHVGIYLCNNKFLHASATMGVTISDLGDAYYSKAYRAARRVGHLASGDFSFVSSEDIRVINIAGKYKSAVIIKQLQISPVLFSQLNPDFDRQVWNAYTLRLPKYIMEQFISQKESILAESVKEQFDF
jgi:hypothetical protein